jgi:hypothetical protein
MYCLFSSSKESAIETFENTGHVKCQNLHELVGKLVHIRYYKYNDDDDSAEVGGLFEITKYTGLALYGLPAYAYGKRDEEVEIPTEVWYKHLTTNKEIHRYVRSLNQPKPATISLLPSHIENYPIVDPNNSYIYRDQLQSTQEYIIHDNGDEPFKVLAHQIAIEIYRDEDTWESDRFHKELITTYTDFEGVWPGYDTSEIANHNSILVNLSNNKYLFIGWDIYEFQTDQPIINYYSPIGNSDVPYPVAYTEDHAYFMIDKKYANLNMFTNKDPVNIYGEFYFSKTVTSDSYPINIVVARKW